MARKFLCLIIVVLCLGSVTAFSATEEEILRQPEAVYSRIQNIPIPDRQTRDWVDLVLLNFALYTEQRADAMAALEGADLLTDEEQAALFYLQGSWARDEEVDYASAQRFYQQALSSIATKPKSLLALQIRHAQAYAYAVGEQLGSALAVLSDMQASVDGSETDSFVQAFINETYGIVYGYSDEYEMSIDYYQQALRAYKHLGYPARVLEVLYGIITTKRYQGKQADALRDLIDYRQYEGEHFPSLNPFFVFYSQAILFADSGDCDAGLKAIDKALSAQGPADFYAPLYLRRSQCLLALGDVEGASRAVEKAVGTTLDTESLGDTGWAADIWLQRAKLAEYKQDFQIAYFALRKAQLALQRSDQQRRGATISSLLRQTTINHKNLEIAELNRRNAEQALREEAAQHRSSRLLWLSATAALFAVGGVFFAAVQRRRNTQIKLAGIELAKARDAADQANLAKSQFLAQMSHEIRTPLNAVTGLSTLMMRSELNTKQRDYLEKIHTASKSLLALVNDILDLSKIESGNLTLEQREFRLNKMTREITDIMMPSVHSKGIQLLVDIGADVPNKLIGDSHRIKQVLTNICANAIKFTEEGTIVIKVERHAAGVDDEDAVSLRFTVSDTGCGIAGDRVEKLFQPFVQADQSITRKYGGTGLGLAISRQLVEIMGGSIGVSSQHGVGSQFYFEIILQAAGEPELPSAEVMERIAGARVLIVDDSEEARLLLLSQLQYLGVVGAAVASAEEAYVRLEQLNNHRLPDLILMDYSLPGDDGLTATRRIKSLPQIRKRLSVVLISASRVGEIGLSPDDECLLDGVLMKPFGLVALAEMVADSLEHEVNTPLVVDPDQALVDDDLTHVPQYRGKRVLVVEDNPINQEIASEFLHASGIEVSIANDGAEALAKLEEQDFDLVLMDIQMPVMDGFTATRSIKSQARWCSTPVVAMTANVLEADKEAAKSAGMDGFLSKPIITSELYMTLTHWLGAPVMVDSVPSESLQADGIDSSEAQSGHLPRELAGWDGRLAMENANNNSRLLLKLLEHFLEDHSDDIRTIRDALSNADFELAKRIAHTLKGVAGALGITRVGELAGELDRALKSHQLEQIEPLIVQLEEPLSAFLHDFRVWRGAGGELEEVQAGIIESLVECQVLLGRFKELADELDPRASEAAEQLQKAVPLELRDEVCSMLQAVENFDFELSLSIAETLEQKL